MANTEDFYSLLGVEKNAGTEDIKKAYRKKAMQYHPDRNPGNKEAEDQFKKVNEAFSILSDPDKRARYDRFGKEGVRGAGGGQGQGINIEDLGDLFGGFGDIFSDFFGGGRRNRGPKPGDDLRFDLEIEFNDAAFGTTKEINVPRFEHCDGCRGTGASAGSGRVECKVCRGRGQVHFTQGFFTMQKPCHNCHGEGSIIENKCKSCGGEGKVKKGGILNIKIPAGVESGTRLKVKGEGGAGEPGAERGSLYVYITVREHEIFTREGDDIHCTIPISFPLAALGGKIKVPTLKGEETLNIPKGTQSHTIIRLRDHGIKRLRNYGNGDQLVTVVIKTPDKLTRRQAELLEEFARESNEQGGRDGVEKGWFDKFKEVLGG